MATARHDGADLATTFFPDFRLERIDIGEATVRVRHGGTGPAVLLLHGHPGPTPRGTASHPLLADAYTVVCPDLRGYGESSKPPDEPDHAQASKRAMARDAVALMRALGHERFAVVGHDRGAYAALRTALDHPHAVTHLAILDAVPIGEALRRADARFAQAWPHWFFFGLPDKPERAILCDPEAWYQNDAASMGAENHADYRRAIHDPATVHSMVEDYRAGLGVDRAADEADMAAGRRVLPRCSCCGRHATTCARCTGRSPRGVPGVCGRPARPRDRVGSPDRRGRARGARSGAAGVPRRADLRHGPQQAARADTASRPISR